MSPVIFATGVLSIPSLMYELGAFPGAVNVVGWTLLNTYCAILQGNFRNRYPGCHSIADMAQVIGGPVVKELVGLLFTVSYVIVAASGIIGVSTALNALSEHSTCTVWFTFIAAVIIAGCASVRKFSHIGWLTWVGFASVYIAVFIIVYASLPIPGLCIMERLIKFQNWRDYKKSTRCSAPDGRFRSRIPSHWQSQLHDRDHSCRHDFCVECRHFSLSPCDLGDAQAQGLPQSRLPQYESGHRILLDLQPRDIRLVRQMDRITVARQRRNHRQAGGIWNCTSRADHQWMSLRARRRQVHVCADPAQLATSAGEHHGALGNMARLYD